MCKISLIPICFYHVDNVEQLLCCSVTLEVRSLSFRNYHLKYNVWKVWHALQTRQLCWEWAANVSLCNFLCLILDLIPCIRLWCDRFWKCPISKRLLYNLESGKEIGVEINDRNLPGMPQWELFDFLISRHNFATWIGDVLKLESVLEMPGRSQMLQRKRCNLLAKFWRLVGCTKIGSR